MKKYTLDEIIELWILYKTPVFKGNNHDCTPKNFQPGNVIVDNIKVIYRWNKHMDFPTFIRRMELDKERKKIEKLKE